MSDPLIDLLGEEGQIRLVVVPPLAMRYGVLEESRTFFGPPWVAWTVRRTG